MSEARKSIVEVGTEFLYSGICYIQSCNSEVGHPSQLHTQLSIFGLDQELSHLASKQIVSLPHCLSLFVPVSETELRCTSYKRSKWRFPSSLNDHVSLPQWNLDWCLTHSPNHIVTCVFWVPVYCYKSCLISLEYRCPMKKSNHKDLRWDKHIRSTR